MLSANYSDILSPELLRARDVCLRETGHDFTLAPTFWESWVAQVTGGITTPHKSSCDVVCEGWRRFRFEVKFSRGFSMRFGNGARRVFKWSITRPQMEREDKPDAVVLIGADDERVWTWAAAMDELGKQITVTIPSHRLGSPKGSDFDALAVPPYDLLPALLRQAHLTYDAKHHATNAARTRRGKLAAADLFD